MGWGAEQSAFAVIGALLLVCGAIASDPRLKVPRVTLVAVFLAAGAFIAPAFLHESLPLRVLVPEIWAAIALPVILLLVLGRRALSASSSHGRIRECVATGLASRTAQSPDVEDGNPFTRSRLERAADRQTPGAELADLAYKHPEVRVAVATNPSTPANVLGWLASNGGEEVVEAIAESSPSEEDDA